MSQSFRNKSRLTWNKEEKLRVADRAAALRRETPTLSSLSALYAAQDVLPESRRKEEFGWHFRPSMLKRLAALEERYRLEPDLCRHEAVAQKAEQLIVDQQGAGSTPASLATEAPQPAPEPPSLAAMCRELGTAFGAALAQQIAPALLNAMRDALTAQLNQSMPQQQDTHPQYDDYWSTTPKPRAPRVAVAGLLGSQRMEIMGSFPQIDFRWLDNGAPGTTVKEVSRTCDEVYLMTKFIRHHTQNAVPREKRVMVNGGVSDLTRLLGARYANGQQH
jgi:hypothetical protein